MNQNRKTKRSGFVFENRFFIYICSPVGAIAQLVEQRTENPCVPAPIPGSTTTKQPLSHVGRGFF